ncbi:uncharacterized protein LOC114166946 [Vigna unguiculata]|uniref:uncharacterized protein LOC114166946 n=1 Tax=Vigna unguiculata TaxID=3917 RepID=UPI001016E903|nr:uncharacterized protein LOC114166946 [Vigna unguiculata]
MDMLQIKNECVASSSLPWIIMDVGLRSAHSIKPFRLPLFPLSLSLSQKRSSRHPLPSRKALLGFALRSPSPKLKLSSHSIPQVQRASCRTPRSRVEVPLTLFQMGEVLVVSKGTVIQQLSHLG